MSEEKVCILMATYNGAAYVRQQIESVLQQENADIQLILSDDGSEDGTDEILAGYEKKYPEHVICHRSGVRFGSPQKHFMYLLSRFHEAPYIMFCDQDDVWHRDKVHKTLEKMRQTEGSIHRPALVHTDLRVVDRSMNQIAPSFCDYSDTDGSRLKLNQLLVQNVVTGCTVMINRPLAEIACTAIPELGVIMHDWWLALLASACGAAAFLNEATIDYRQHESNSVGAKNVRSASYLWERFSSQKRMRDALTDTAVQAESFLKCYNAFMNPKQTELIRAFASTKDKGMLGRDLIYLRHHLLKDGVIRIIPQLLGM